jgi:hypothetical protein
LEHIVEVVITVGVEVSTGVVMRERNVGAGVCPIKERLAPGALVGVVIVAIDCFAKGFGDIDTFASGVHLTRIPRIT